MNLALSFDSHRIKFRVVHYSLPLKYLPFHTNSKAREKSKLTKQLMALIM